MQLLKGKSLIAVCGGLTLLYTAFACVMAGGYLAGLPYVMKPTAHFAFALFFMAFTASSFHTLVPGRYSRWAIRNRRYIGLSFAAVHFIHLFLVLSNITLTDESRPLTLLVGGGLAYLFIVLMAATSNNWSVQKMGAKNWRRLHRTGSWYIWLIFIYGAPSVLDGNYMRVWITLFCFIALGLRIAAYCKKKTAKT
ncbi:cytochrome b family protein [Kordiimonas pumila]|uniref:Ferric oxidoreductase domain-containing protein n=1 Tax=Kordiimonas pumila TaxID=2161677 RepID=A0ABV7D6B4_9PROT|nr:hypothetical protein [Kordiimonas pumila]